jgi:hypothetical protein
VLLTELAKNSRLLGQVTQNEVLLSYAGTDLQTSGRAGRVDQEETRHHRADYIRIHSYMTWKLIIRDAKVVAERKAELLKFVAIFDGKVDSRLIRTLVQRVNRATPNRDFLNKELGLAAPDWDEFCRALTWK